MDSKTSIMEILNKTKKGQFAEAVQLVKEIKVEKEVALRILIGVSHACYNDSKNSSKIDKDEMYNLLCNSVCFIDTIDESQLLTYIQAVFHIIKYTCDKEYFEALTKMEFLMVPVFLNDSIKSIEECAKVYQAAINKMCNSLSRLSEAKNTSYNAHILGLIKIILKAKSKISCAKETLSIAFKLLSVIDNLDFNSCQFCEFYFILLERLAIDIDKSKDNSEEIKMLIHFFSIVLFKLIEAKDFQIAATFIENMETQTSLVFNQKDFTYCHTLFRGVTSIFPLNTNEMQVNFKNCMMKMKNLKHCNKQVLYSVINFLEEPLVLTLSYYKSAECKIWSELSSEMIINILQLVKDDICSYFLAASKKCSCGCLSEKNYNGLLKVGCKISVLLRNYIETNKNISEKFYFEIQKWQTYFCEILKKMKAKNCNKWSKYYKEMGTYTYNLATILYRQKHTACVDIYQCFMKYSWEFEGTSVELLKNNLSEVTFNVICEEELKNNKVEICMAFAALHCLLYPQRCNSIFQNWWIRAKTKVKEDSNIQQQTLVAILEKHSKLLSGITNPQLLLTRDKKIELLTYELSRYRLIWRSKESLMAAFSHFLLFAEVLQIAKVILDIFGDGDINMHDNMPAVFLKARKKLEEFAKSNSDRFVKMALAVIDFYNYKNSLKETADENLQEMEKTMQVIESAKEKFEPIPKDPNDECDIVSAYSNLRLSKFTDVLKPLNKCMESIGSLVSQSYEPNIVKNIAKLLANIGFEYRLHCYSVKSLQAFEMSIKFAEIIEDNESHLLAISFLIENADVKRNFVKELINKGDQLAKVLQQNNRNDRHNKSLAIYQISKAKAFLYEDTDLSFESWKIADALVAAHETQDEIKMLRAELYIIHYKLTKSCGFLDGEHKKYPMTFKLHCANDIVVDLSYAAKLSSHELCILFDTVYELAKVYYLMRMPRDLRAYTKLLVLLTQKIVLPMRCVSFLILLAHSDLLSCKFDHCNVKISGINDIFCLSESRPFIFNEKNTYNDCDMKIVDNEVDRCTSQIQELALDFPQHTRQYSPASPALVVESFKTPQFLSHEKSCMCFVCLSFEYHQLLLQKYHLEALLNMYQKDERVAEEYINGAVMLYKTLRRNFDVYTLKAKNLISESLIINFDDSFRECYGNILYEYSYYLIRQSQKSEALKINTELIQLIKTKKNRYIYLYNDALLQKLVYVMPQPNRQSENFIVSQIKKLSLTPNENSSLERTPKSKKSTVTVAINSGRKYSPPKRKPKRMHALFTSPNDSENKLTSPTDIFKPATPKTKVSKSESDNIFAFPKTYAKKKAVLAPDTPNIQIFNNGFETPKIQIFTDDESTASIRKSRKKQPTSIKKQMSVGIPESSESAMANKKALTRKSIRKTLNSAMVLGENDDPEAISDVQSTIKKSASGKTLRTSRSTAKLLEINQISKEISGVQPSTLGKSSRTRGQLLTQKIKESTLKSTSSSVLSKGLSGEILPNRIDIPMSKKISSSATDESEASSVISESPEHKIVSAKTQDRLEKLKLSAKKANKVMVDKEKKKNLLGDFLDSEASSDSSKSTKYTGAIRKSTRNRVL